MDAQHEPTGVEWEVVADLGTDEEAALVVGYLEGCGLSATVDSTQHFNEMPVHFGLLGDVRVRVPAEQAEEARRLLDERDAAAEAGEIPSGEEPA